MYFSVYISMSIYMYLCMPTRTFSVTKWCKNGCFDRGRTSHNHRVYFVAVPPCKWTKYIPLCCRFPRGSWRWGGKHGGQPQPIRRRGRGLGPGWLGGGWQLQPPCLHAAVQWRWARGRGSGCFTEKDVTLSKARNRNGASVMQHFHRSPILQLGLLPSGLFTLFCEKVMRKVASS